MKSRIFVSSVVEGFERFRKAARQGILAVGGEPVLVNEDFPSVATSSRNACLDAIDSSDVFVSILGERGGWETPSGKLVVEEEYERALVRQLPILVFFQSGTRDAAAEQFARRLSDYVDGVFRRNFTAPEELQTEIERALRVILDTPQGRAKMPSPKRDYFAQPYTIQGMTMLRFVLTPERDEEIIDPVRLASEAFRRRLYEIAHADGVGLLSYEHPKTSTIERDDLIVYQTETNRRHGEGEHVRVQLSGSGELVVDANVTGRVQRGGQFVGLDSMVIAVEDIEAVFRLCFAFSAAFYDEIDQFKRHQRFQYNVALSGLDYRVIERNPRSHSSYPVSMRNRGVIQAFEEARWITRTELRQPTSEVERVIELLVRRAAN